MTTPYQPFLVGNQRTGVDVGIDPWLTPQDAYQLIQDARQFRGVITKRDGYSWFASMPHAVQGSGGHEYSNISNVTTTINATVTTYGNHGLSPGQLIQITDVVGIGPGADGVPLLGTRWTVNSTPTGTTFTLNNGDAFAGAYSSGGTLSIFPGLPIMCISVWTDTHNVPNLIVLDTRRAAIFDTTQYVLKPIGYSDQFTGTVANLFWWENYRGNIFFTNNIDNIFYWNGSQLAVGLTAFTPQIIEGDATAIVNNCLMIKALNNRLCLYNTNETMDSATASYYTRVRWCQAGVSPVVGGSPPTSPDLGGSAWYQGVPNLGGGAFDLTDSLYIISQGQIQTNNLVVSQGQNQQFSIVYEQRPTSDLQRPFAFVKIAVSRNVNSTFGTVILDRELQLVGNTGLVLCDGNSFGRYDDKIPDFSIDVMSQDNFTSAFGIRDDVYWQSWLLFTSGDSPNGLNDQVLVYNYQDRSFAFYRMSLSCAGLFPYPGIDPEWASYGSVLPDYDWTDFGDATWISIAQQDSTMLLGGGYDGNVWWMDQGGGDAADNVAYGGIVPTGYVANGNAITMNLVTRQWFPFMKEGLAAQFGYIDFLVEADPTTVVEVDFNVDNGTSNYLESEFTCVPFEDIEFSTIQNITQASPAVVTSEDHGLITGQTVYIYAVQGMTELNNAFFIVTVIDVNTISLNGVDSTGFNPYTGDGVLALSPITETIFWTRVWSGQTGVFHQMNITTSGVDQNFELHAVIPWFKGTGRIYKG